MQEEKSRKTQLEEYPEVFADIVNTLIFKGKRVVKAEDLQNEDLPFNRKKNKLEHQVIQVWKKGHVKFSYIAFENPAEFSQYIPIRSIGEVGNIYCSEIGSAKNTADLFPVIDIVLYLGHEKHWKAPTNLMNCFHMAKELQPYLNDYKVNLFEIAWLDEETVSKFQSDFRFIVDYYVQARKNKFWEPMYGEADHINEVFEMLYDMTDDERFLIVLEEPRLGGNSTMPSVVLDRIEYRGMMMGRDDGLTTGKEYGKEDLAKFLLLKGKVTVEDIQEATGWKKNKIERLLKEDNGDPFANFKRRALK